MVVELSLATDVLNKIRASGGQFHERAYLFVLGAIEYLQTQLPERRHVSGPELALACRDLAIEQYGLLAQTVLGHWGIRCSRDLGSIVFALVEIQLLSTQPEDRETDFDNVFDFDDAFAASYVWRGVPGWGTEASIPPEDV